MEKNMANKQVKRNSSRNAKKTKDSNGREIAGVIVIALGILIGLSVYTQGNSGFITSVSSVIMGVFGLIGYAVPLIIFSLGVILIATKKINVRASRFFSFLLGILGAVLLIHLISAANYSAKDGYVPYIERSYSVGTLLHLGAGALGGAVTYPVHHFLGSTLGIILSLTLILISVMLLTKLSIRSVGEKTAEVTKKAAMATASAAKKIADNYNESRERRQEEKKKLFVDDIEKKRRAGQEAAPWGTDQGKAGPKKGDTGLLKDEGTEKEDTSGFDIKNGYSPLYPGLNEKIGKRKDFINVDERNSFIDTDIKETEELKDADTVPVTDLSMKDLPQYDPQIPEDEDYDIPEDAEIEDLENDGGDSGFDDDDDIPEIENDDKAYVYPDIDFLQPGTSSEAGYSDKEEMRYKTGIIESTLRSFSINAKVTNTVRGPVVTRYELQPAPGVKVRRIVELTNDIALNLAAQDIRIEAPIPGKAAIGIEVPNEVKNMVCVRDLIDSEEFRHKKNAVTFALGKDIVGKNIYADISRMPHLLIAGETGSGKSVCINTIIVSLLYGASPKDVQLILVDPKKVELKPYENIPHLRIPIVTDPKKAAGALNWAVAEMMNRYKTFAMKGAKDLPRFNAVMAKEGHEKLPYLVIIIDELADLMMTASKEVEDAICRIAQLGRAAGIHLIIATQTPRVNVITGNIKVNVPTRIAFAVSSQVDSRVILDMAGAEKLLGRGDMLYTPPGSSKPIRVQGCYIDDSEIETITDFLRNENTIKYDEDVIKTVEDSVKQDGGQSDDDLDVDDDRMQEAVRLALEYNQVSSSMLQRRMKIGFNRAARIVDAMEEKGFVGPSEGAKPRQILITWEQFNELYGSGE